MTDKSTATAPQTIDVYSRRMRRLKFGLPLVAAGLVTSLFVWPYLQPEEILPQTLSTQKTEITTKGLTMTEPRFSGTTEDQEPFAITAKTASQGKDDPALVELIAIHANMELQQLGTLQLTASGGDYHTVTRRLNLIGPVELSAANGVTMQMGDLRANLKQGRGDSVQPVIIDAGAAQLKAGGLTITESGNRIIFNRRIHITYDPAKPFPVFSEPAAKANHAIDGSQANQNNETIQSMETMK